MTSASPNIGEVIRAQREGAGLSREALAYKAGISLKTLERLEAGKHEPRRSTLVVIEQALSEERETSKEAA